DIFELPVEIAFAGIDQRRAHVLAREVAQSSGWPVPVALHTPLVSSLKGKGRMDATVSPAEGKMSKSDPTGAIPLPSSPEEIAERLRGAFCPAKEVEGNPVVELALSVIFPWSGSLEVERAEKFGGPVTYASPEEILSAWTSGALHPVDLKSAVARALGSIVAPASKALEGVPGADGTGL
ncbi:MAG TPA: tyrosine--tRNA ligase, partial [Thermoplasmata archaeon]|nr:tyrosine--tRNA ligase [Thermoplasmata archaeon]